MANVLSGAFKSILMHNFSDIWGGPIQPHFICSRAQVQAMWSNITREVWDSGGSGEDLACFLVCIIYSSRLTHVLPLPSNLKVIIFLQNKGWERSDACAKGQK